ncbi:hypothetical protein HWB76_gp203 [Streptomyces phage Blueeyedbeauty]|uniref:Uncharacterized protein n=1 Tax=Streptomyces phage Blueeyedbeauty TaxID=2250336 RepID=A0A345L1P7_9CAUD|nr:hypothetical protein HWB76_gp203 [Streptomyces phage Blueeyedbeauty]AXH49199.1 hypothetical protein SEA_BLUEEYEDBEAUTY_56 [Streptomyces phage Blueeyedbeauty]
MHKTIKRFGFEGKVNDDADFPRIRAQYESLILREMRELGYVPVLDLGPYWSTEYVKPDDAYEFVLSVYGVYLGRRRSWEVEGISNGREIKRPTPPTKSKQPSEPAE